MGSLFGSKPPPPPPPPPVPQQPQGLAASESAMKRGAALFGPGATDVTGPQGLTTPASTGNKTLLGG